MSMFTRTALASVLWVVAPLASAATDTAQFQVSIAIENSCELAVGNVVFPTRDTLAANIDGIASGSVTCSNIGAYTVAFDNGAGTGATLDSRKMTGPSAATINYVLARDTNRTELLGSGVGAVTIGGTSSGNGTANAFTVYGRVAGGQNPKPIGNYLDTVTATVTF